MERANDGDQRWYYEGEVKNGIRDGFGEAWINSDSCHYNMYKGFWKDDKPHGKGIYYYYSNKEQNIQWETIPH